LQAYRFSNDDDQLAIVKVLAITVAHADHQPNHMAFCNRCDVRFEALSVDGVSNEDSFFCAAGADAMFGQKFAEAAA
jgi:pterin-4a-carbinolamine dehydratase